MVASSVVEVRLVIMVDLVSEVVVVIVAVLVEPLLDLLLWWRWC